MGVDPVAAVDPAMAGVDPVAAVDPAMAGVDPGAVGVDPVVVAGPVAIAEVVGHDARKKIPASSSAW